ncbi:hypothetical protein [Microbacterium elymi]|uniref:Uncharacterized protein n=1 Tax=Microbacterium elymi TaxID=2909587 RepID=A0ABY5NMA6_9MICO|nr:hypothetical protein [Microbacterium elymi]UUT36241.1 hypothetical protein L2X98_24880 [Microbacterium elymi]
MSFFSPKYAVTPATVQVPGPAVAPDSGVVMPIVTSVSVMPGLDAAGTARLIVAAAAAGAARERERDHGCHGDDADGLPSCSAHVHA